MFDRCNFNKDKKCQDIIKPTTEVKKGKQIILNNPIVLALEKENKTL